MRDHHRCPKCSHTEILFVPRVRDLAGDPLVTYAQTDGAGQLAIYGLLEQYTCRRCGYTELYARLPHDIPVERIPQARVLRGGEGGYR